MYSDYTENSALVVMETLCEVAIQRLGEVHTGLRLGDLRETYHSEKLDVDGTITLKWIFTRMDGETWTGMLSIKIGTGCGLLIML
jgi:hypothetical protein